MNWTQKGWSANVLFVKTLFVSIQIFSITILWFEYRLIVQFDLYSKCNIVVFDITIFFGVLTLLPNFLAAAAWHFFFASDDETMLTSEINTNSIDLCWKNVGFCWKT